MHKNQEIYHICYDYGVKIFIQMVAKTSECRINTESFSHASGSVPKKDHAEVFGIRVLPFGVCSPISKEEMQTASLTTPNRIELEPEEGVVYTEIQRERF